MGGEFSGLLEKKKEVLVLTFGISDSNFTCLFHFGTPVDETFCRTYYPMPEGSDSEGNEPLDEKSVNINQ